MALKPQVYPQVSYAQTGGYHTKNSYDHQCQEDYYSQQEDCCSENAYCNSGSSMQQIKPYPYIAPPQPDKHHVFGYQGYDQHQNHNNYNDYNISGYDKHSKGKHQIDGHHDYDYNNNGYDKHSKGKHHNYIDYDSHGYDKHSKGEHHSDGFYGKTYGAYDNHDSHKYQNAPNSYETVSCNGYYTEVRDDCCSPYYGHKQGAEWISKSLDD